MFKHFRTILLTAILALSLCSFASTEVSADTLLEPDYQEHIFTSTVYRATLMEPAIVNTDGMVTAKFNVRRFDSANLDDAKAVTNAKLTYTPTESQPDLKVSANVVEEVDKNGISFLNLTKSTFTVTGNLTNVVMMGNNLCFLNITDHDTIETVALDLQPGTEEPIQYDYGYSPDTLNSAYLYWDSAKGSTLDALLNKDIVFNPEPDCFGKTSTQFTWDKHYICNGNALFDNSGRDFLHEDHGKHLELYFSAAFSYPEVNMLRENSPATAAVMSFDPSNPDLMHEKYPTDYILRDLSTSPLIIPNEKSGNTPLLQMDLNGTETIKHDPASIHNNPADRKIKYEWNLKGDDGSSLSAETEQPVLAPASVSGMNPGVVYTITCNAVLTDLSGATIDELSYADTHTVAINAINVSEAGSTGSTSTPPVQQQRPLNPSPKTGDTNNVNAWLLLIAVAAGTSVVILKRVMKGVMKGVRPH